MKLFWRAIGRVGYVVGYVPISMYLRIGRRTRVVVRHQDRILVVKSWLGRGKWDLPGGGLHKNETPSEGAARELKEELGLEVDAAKIALLKEEEFKVGLVRYPACYMSIALTELPAALKLQMYEIVEVRWVDAVELKDLSMTSESLRTAALEVLQSSTGV